MSARPIRASYPYRNPVPNLQQHILDNLVTLTPVPGSLMTTTFPEVSCWLLDGDEPGGIDSLRLPHHPLPPWAVDHDDAGVAPPTDMSPNDSARSLPLGSHVRTPLVSENRPRPQPSPLPHGATGNPHLVGLNQGAPINQACHSPRLLSGCLLIYTQALNVEDLVSRFDQVLDQLLHNQAVAERRQENTEAQLASLVDEFRRMSRSRHGERSSIRRAGDHPRPSSPVGQLEWDDAPGQKDSAGNYVRKCIQEHIALSFGFSPTGAIPISPSERFKNQVLSDMNRGGPVHKPFNYDWDSPPSNLYNLCIEGAFCVDFWASVESGVYDLDRIPPKYQRRRPFIKSLRRYFGHIKQMIRLASRDRTQQVAFRTRSTKNSRKTTTFRNRCGAASYIHDPRLAACVHDLVAAVGTEGVSSDEEGEPFRERRGRAREYLVFDKAWRSKHLVEIYRWLDRKHSETRNIQGAPIRTRLLRPGITRDRVIVPRGLPIDCYDKVYLRSLPMVQRRVLHAEPAADVEHLWLEILASELRVESDQ